MTATIAVRERPILMSGPMVRATLRERDPKTQTRRVVLPQPVDDGRPVMIWWPGGKSWNGSQFQNATPPFGRPGDRLWVRENLRQGADGIWTYEADGTPIELDEDDARVPSMLSWAHHVERDYCVSIHMPRWASRITLELTGVRVERVQDISQDDAVAEGLTQMSKDGGRTYKYGIPDRDGLPGSDDDGWDWFNWYASPAHAYARLWDQINAKRGYAWDVNPYVWVLSFTRVTP
jgi:hypothetical protein